MNKTCDFCSGTGQINYFKGVSRFLLTTEDCPECGGVGFTVDENDNIQKDKNRKRKKK